MQDPCIVCSEIGKHIDNKWIFQDVSMRCGRGECFAILGPSGCGKTTLLNMVSGLLPCDRGEIRVETGRLAYVFQEPRLLPWKTVRENVLFVLENSRSNRAHETALRLLSDLHLEHVLDAYPRQLSGGMRQRVSIARAFANDPEVILMDEPFSGLDVQLVEDIIGDICTLMNRYSPAMLYVTHDPMEAASLADRAMILSDDGVARQPISFDVPRDERDDDYLLHQAHVITKQLKEKPNYTMKGVSQ